MRSWLPYTAARVGLFLAAFGVVYLFGARSWMALILAWLISGLASYVLLSSLRDRMSASVVDRIEKNRGSLVGDRLDGGAAREDHLQDAPADAPAAGDAPGDAPAADGTGTDPAGTDAAGTAAQAAPKDS
ncbi:DUF4229 domain-containing protein [Nocardiopsis flavescens]|uniref:DUF4229 domain-containing protein n=1 Tax=Nocardiopsis flavescens TaxID=758803 RepID=A0A1M6TMM6_9ACTN|nr:DUF4229 domain-containing protein [Nocardiopsis flavescens]SHK58170.1 Protein of unknown function [Nocardiopsis flavescens]